MIRLLYRDVNAVLLLTLVLAAGESPEFCQLRTYDGGHQSTAEGSSAHWRQREMDKVEMKVKEEVVEHEDELAQKEVTEMIQRHVDQKVLEQKKITLVEAANQVEEGEHEEEGEGEQEEEEEGKQVPPGQTPWFQFNYRSQGKRTSVLLLLV
jgi:hypothetical protein